jgi:hypothetical protein
VGELPESVIEDLRAAAVPLAVGMLDTYGDRVVRLLDGGRVVTSSGAEASECVAETPDTGAIPPDPRDRATFLLLVDEAERQGVHWLRDGGFSCVLSFAREVAPWDGTDDTDGDGPTRPRLIAALARALRESVTATPKESAP